MALFFFFLLFISQWLCLLLKKSQFIARKVNDTFLFHPHTLFSVCLCCPFLHHNWLITRGLSAMLFWERQPIKWRQVPTPSKIFLVNDRLKTKYSSGLCNNICSQLYKFSSSASENLYSFVILCNTLNFSSLSFIVERTKKITYGFSVQKMYH